MTWLGRTESARTTLCALVAALALASPARAQTAEETSRALFDEARVLMEAGRYDEACPKFARSMALNASIGAQLNLARCHERDGKLASAFQAFKKAAGMARAAGDPERAAVAHRQAGVIEPRLSYLTIEVAGPVSEIVVERNGVSVPVEQLGVPIAVDAGEHRVEVRGPEGTWSDSIAIGERETKTLGPPSSSEPLPPEAAPADDGNGVLIASVSLLVAGGAGLVVGGVLGAMAQSDRDEAESDPNLCPNKQCFPAGREVIDAAEAKATGADVAFILGSVFVVAGAVLLTLDLSDTFAEAPALSFTARPGGLTVSGSF